MLKNFVLTLIFVFVDIYLSAAVVPTKGPVNNILFQKLEPFSMEDFKKPLPFDDAKICLAPNFHCTSQAHELDPVCAFDKDYGLLDFKNVCQVHLHNCMAQPKGTKFAYGEPSVNDIIYYNGVDEECYYYFKRTKSLKEAILLYYKVGHETEPTTEYREIIENSITNNSGVQQD